MTSPPSELSEISEERLRELREQLTGPFSFELDLRDALDELLRRRASARAEEGWRPIASAPRDGTYVLLGTTEGSWVGHYCRTSPGGFVFDNPWHSLMLNHRHIPKWSSGDPTHWRPCHPLRRRRRASEGHHYQ